MIKMTMNINDIGNGDEDGGGFADNVADKVTIMVNLMVLTTMMKLERCL